MLVGKWVIRTALSARFYEEPGFEARRAQVTASRRIGEPQDIADVALFLASDQSSYVNGQAIAVGEGVPLPTRIDFDRLAEEHQPHSRTAPFATAWQQDQLSAADLTEIVKRWRHQP